MNTPGYHKAPVWEKLNHNQEISRSFAHQHKAVQHQLANCCASRDKPDLNIELPQWFVTGGCPRHYYASLHTWQDTPRLSRADGDQLR